MARSRDKNERYLLGATRKSSVETFSFPNSFFERGVVIDTSVWISVLRSWKPE
jgi:hypothetical protein